MAGDMGIIPLQTKEDCTRSSQRKHLPATNGCLSEAFVHDLEQNVYLWTPFEGLRAFEIRFDMELIVLSW